MRNKTLSSRSLVCFLALLLTRCGGNVPTGPTRETREGTDKPAASGLPRVSGLSAHADWPIEILRAPNSGQTFQVDKHGKLPQPAPKFRFKATAPVDVPEGTVMILFLTAGGKQCGFGAAHNPIPFTANVPRTIDVPNDSILVGPEACASIVQDCTPSQCKFPLTTTKMRILFGNGDQAVGQANESVQYKWKTYTPGGSGSPTLACGATPAPDTVSCGIPTARCSDGSYSCSSSPFTCWDRGYVFCYVCPGPFCGEFP